MGSSLLRNDYEKCKNWMSMNEDLFYQFFEYGISKLVKKFVELHSDFGGNRALLALSGMTGKNNAEDQEELEKYALEFGRNLELITASYRPYMIDYVRNVNSSDVNAISLVALSSYISAEQNIGETFMLLNAVKDFEEKGEDVTECSLLWGALAVLIGM